MSAIVDFVNARLDEDEEGVRMIAERLARYEDGDRAPECLLAYGAWMSGWQKERAEAKIKAQRAILAEINWGGLMPVLDDYDVPATRIAKMLAAIYADHPDFLPEWQL